MMDEYCKCRFCKWYDSYEGCDGWGCDHYSSYEPNKARIIEKAQEQGISVADVIALINMN